MRRLIAGSLFLTIVFVLMTGATLLVARAQPPTDRVAMLHLDECHLPCWIGITPGKTTVAEAKQRLQEVFGTSLVFTLDDARQHWTDVLITFPNNNQHFNVSVGDGQPRNNILESAVVTAIAIYPNGTMPGKERTSFGELYSLLGNPAYDLVGYQNAPCPPKLIYYNFHMEMELDISHCDNRATFATSVVMPVIAITLYDQMPPEPGFQHRWRGFGQTLYLSTVTVY